MSPSLVLGGTGFLASHIVDTLVPLDIRVGLWIPETGEGLIPSSDSLLIDQHGRLVVGRYEPTSESRE